MRQLVGVRNVARGAALGGLERRAGSPGSGSGDAVANRAS